MGSALSGGEERDTKLASRVKEMDVDVMLVKEGVGKDTETGQFVIAVVERPRQAVWSIPPGVRHEALEAIFTGTADVIDNDLILIEEGTT